MCVCVCLCVPVRECECMCVYGQEVVHPAETKADSVT